jgi:hypothetical protein
MVMPSTGGAPRELTKLEEPGRVRRGTWTSDGSHILRVIYMTQTNQAVIWVMENSVAALKRAEWGVSVLCSSNRALYRPKISLNSSGSPVWVRAAMSSTRAF